jgi:hypothetical protein
MSTKNGLRRKHSLLGRFTEYCYRETENLGGLGITSLICNL